MPDTIGIPIEEGFFCLDGSWRFTFVNRITLSLLGKSQEEIQGKVIWDEIPTLVGSAFEQACRNVLERRSATRVEIRSSKSATFYHLVVFPSPGTGGVAVYWRDVTADKKARETLETLVEKLKLADESRIAFINTLSHELRNPLAAISMGLMLLKEAPAESEQAEKALSIMERQTSQLSRLVDDLLDVTRIAQKKIVLKKERIDLNEVVYHTVSDFQPQFAEKGVNLDLELHPEIIPMDADRARLTQAIGNLLHNSVKFTGKGGKTRVTVKVDQGAGRQALIIVRDNGCDLAIPDREIFGRIIIHHINPITVEDIERGSDCLFDPDNLICTSHNTSQAIHYGDASLLIRLPQERRKGDTHLWQQQRSRAY